MAVKDKVVVMTDKAAVMKDKLVVMKNKVMEIEKLSRYVNYKPSTFSTSLEYNTVFKRGQSMNKTLSIYSLIVSNDLNNMQLSIMK